MVKCPADILDRIGIGVIGLHGRDDLLAHIGMDLLHIRQVRHRVRTAGWIVFQPVLLRKRRLAQALGIHEELILFVIFALFLIDLIDLIHGAASSIPQETRQRIRCLSTAAQDTSETRKICLASCPDGIAER